MFVFLLVFQKLTILIPWFKHYDPNCFRDACTCLRLSLCVREIWVWRISPKAAGGTNFSGMREGGGGGELKMYYRTSAIKNLTLCYLSVPSKHSSRERRHEDVFRFHLHRRSSRRLAQTSSKHLEGVLKSFCKNFFKKSSRHLQEVFKTFSRRPQDLLLRRFQDFFKTS